MALLAVVMTGCLAPGAQLLAPQKASEVVTLLAGAPATSGCSPSERPVATRIRPDGVNEPFTIPAGKVLVLTGLEWFSTSTGTGKSVLLSVLLRPAGVQTVYNSHAQSTSAGAGYAGHQSLIPNVVVKPGVPLCVTQFIDNQPSAGSLPGAVILHGFLTDDE